MSYRTILSTGCLVFSVLTATAETSNAASWMFAPPIYKRPPVSPMLVRPTSADAPCYTQPQGEYVNTSMRDMNSIINIQGRSYDDYQVRQTTVQQGGEF